MAETEPNTKEEQPQEEEGAAAEEEQPGAEFFLNAVHKLAEEEESDQNWEGKLFFTNDNKFHREDGWTSKGAAGTYMVSSDYKDLILKWDGEDLVQETLTTEDLGTSFSNEAGFTLTMEADQKPPEWFRNKFTDLDDGRCMKACIFCCPASVTQHEGEPETFAQKMWDVMEDAVEKLDDAIDAVEEKVGDVMEDIVDAVEDTNEAILRALGLDDKFKQVSDNTLDDVAPKAGDMVVEDAANFVPAFKQLDKATPGTDLTGEASKGCSETILGFREKIHDFCEDVIEFCAEGIKGIVNCLYKVVSWILRACKEGVKFAIDMLKKVIPGCCETACLGCMGLTAKLASWMAKVMNNLINMVEDCIKAGLRAVGVPEWICEKIDFNGDNKPDADNTNDDEEPLKKKKAREAGEQAPQQEEMEPVV